MKYFSLCVMLLLLSCHPETKQEFVYFFNLRHFFEQECIRMNASKKKINKLVQHNDKVEQKELFIPDWKNELRIFIESDINKPAWRDSYRVVEDSSHVSYYALDSTLRTRSINIKKNVSGKIIQVDVTNQTSNILYQSREHLMYIPDSLYLIDKQQRVLLMGDNHYQISGRLK